MPGGERLLIRAACGWSEQVVGQTVRSWRSLMPDARWSDTEPVIIADLREPRWRDSQVRSDSEVVPVSAVSVVIQGIGQPFGTLSALSSAERVFSPQDVTFLQTVADLLSTLIKSKRQEALSHEVEARYQSIVANIPGVVYRWGMRPDGSSFLPFISEGCRQIFELDAATLERDPMKMRDMLNPDNDPAFDAAAAESVRTLAGFEWESRVQSPSGQTRWVTVRSRPQRQPNGDTLWDGVLMDVSELKRAQETMREAKEEAEKANRAKSEFLSRMSHELRTPLNAILGFGQLLSLERLSNVQSSSVEQILKGGRHLLDLINEVLDIARIEAGSMELSLERVNAASALAEAALFTGPLAEQHRVGFVSQVAAGCDLTVLADRGRLLQVLLNLFSNAVKYNREGGVVRFACEMRPDRPTVRFSISDTGPGLSSDEAARLFVPFQRLNAPQRGVPGTGIGLTITRSLVEAMDGAVGVETRPGEGCTFYVDLPAALGPPTAPAALAERVVDPIADAARARCARSSLSMTNLPTARPSSGSSRCAPTGACSPRLTAVTGLAAARDQGPDVILLDLHLPDLPGEEVIRRLHHEPRTRSIPVVALGADITPGQMARLSQHGVREFVTTPFMTQSLLSTLDALLAAAPPLPHRPP